MSSHTDYDESFFKSIRDSSERSASIVVPIIIELLRPATVIDIGCGDGTWLCEFKKRGVSKIVGVDGAGLNERELRIPKDQYFVQDLSKSFSRDEKFDLAISLEVAEHLREESADLFVGSLVHLAPLVLFSAAIPYQGGTAHINEQWPEYWAQKFKERKFLPIDCIRPRIWDNKDVAWWYSQNMILFVEESHLYQSPDLLRLAEQNNRGPIAIVHPRCYTSAIKEIDRLMDANPPSFLMLVRRLPSALIRLLARILRSD